MKLHLNYSVVLSIISCTVFMGGTQIALAQSQQVLAATARNASLQVAPSTSQPLTTVAPTAGKTDPVTGMELVFVKGGCYMMGDFSGKDDENSRPVHEVCVSDFYLGKYEVTQKQWEQVMKNNPSIHDKCGLDCPVDNVSWDMAQSFLSELNRLSKKQYRLPTEAEWEYAARSGGKNELWAGSSDLANVGAYAWFRDNSDGTPHPVGLKKANGLGLFDMTGNAREWTSDVFSADYYTSKVKDNPTGPKDGELRTMRGGDWAYDLDKHGQTFHRNEHAADQQNEVFGFRVLLPVK